MTHGRINHVIDMYDRGTFNKKKKQKLRVLFLLPRIEWAIREIQMDSKNLADKI